jgi:hypothetical protein
MIFFVVVYFLSLFTIDIQSLQNILLNVCYVAATSTGLGRLLFFFAAAINTLTVLMKLTRQVVCAVKQSIFLDVYAFLLNSSYHNKVNLVVINKLVCLLLTDFDALESWSLL